MLTEKILNSAANQDLEALIKLDAMGLIMGGEESVDDYIKRIRCLKNNLENMEKELKTTGKYENEEVLVEKQDKIPKSMFHEVASTTKDLYSFSIDWVPGFFINPNMSWLFGGCAFYFFPDFFAMFILRKSFAKKDKWLIYNRQELLSHELCHVARAGLGSEIFEETFAYQTSGSKFRSLLGGIFRSPKDSFALLGSTFLLLFAQIARVFAFPSLPIFIFWSIIAVVFSFLLGRHLHYMQIFNNAIKNLSQIESNSTMSVLFRCTDAEIKQISKTANKQELQSWLQNKSQNNPRWEIIQNLQKQRNN